jgi:acyl-CoA synthetase (AMP-forming)/AMP-acid ligase II
MAQQSEIPSAKQGEENFVCLLEDNARRLSAQPALLWNGGELSWAELDQRASGFAHFSRRTRGGARRSNRHVDRKSLELCGCVTRDP